MEKEYEENRGNKHDFARGERRETRKVRTRKRKMAEIKKEKK